MEWQQIMALGIVALTAALFIHARVRRRRGILPCNSNCGCAGSTPKGQSIVYHARKGARPEIIVKVK